MIFVGKLLYFKLLPGFYKAQITPLELVKKKMKQEIVAQVLRI